MVYIALTMVCVARRYNGGFFILWEQSYGSSLRHLLLDDQRSSSPVVVADSFATTYFVEHSEEEGLLAEVHLKWLL